MSGLKVGVIGPLDEDSFAENICDGLRGLGIETHALGPVNGKSGSRAGDALKSAASRSWSSAALRIQRELIHRLRDDKYDLIINVEASTHPLVVEQLRKVAPRVVMWFPDAISNVGRMWLLNPAYKAVFVKDPLFAERLREVYGIPAHYMPEAANPKWHRPEGSFGVDGHIVVVGNLYETRTRLLHRLVGDGIPLRIYGARPSKWANTGSLMDFHAGHVVTRGEKSRVFRAAAGVLNNLSPAEMNSVNCRLFEATASGAAVLCEDRPCLAALFEPDREVLTFDSYTVLVEQAQRLLQDRDHGRAIGNAAALRSSRSHTYEDRLSRILEIAL